MRSYSQAVENSKDYEPIVVVKRNKHKPLVLVDELNILLDCIKMRIFKHDNCAIELDDGIGKVYKDGKLMFKGDRLHCD